MNQHTHYHDDLAALRELDITDDRLATAETVLTVMRECFRAARERQRIRVTEDGQTIAWIVPAQEPDGPDLEIGRDPGGNTDFGQYILQAIRAARDGRRTRIVMHGTPVATISPYRPDGPDLLTALVYGDGIDDLKTAALRKAQRLYGDAAPLQIIRISTLRTSSGSQGKFTADITVWCRQLPAGWDVP